MPTQTSEKREQRRDSKQNFNKAKKFVQICTTLNVAHVKLKFRSTQNNNTSGSANVPIKSTQKSVKLIMKHKNVQVFNKSHLKKKHKMRLLTGFKHGRIDHFSQKTASFLDCYYRVNDVSFQSLILKQFKFVS
jgi:hypothetical protein